MALRQKAVFGGGCFWCTEAIFQRLRGVVSVTPGYAGGTSDNPNYYQVGTGKTGHAEVILIEFDPTIISYQQLLEVFWHSHDPTTPDRQGADVGTEYRSIILTTSDDQTQQAKTKLQELQDLQTFGQPIVTQVKPLGKFYPAEDHHHNYYNQNNDQPYCQLVINPKLEKLVKQYGKLLK